MCNRNLVFHALLSLLPLSLSWAQDRPEPGSVQVPVQQENGAEDASPASVSTAETEGGHVRVWQFAPTEEERLAVALLPQGGSLEAALRGDAQSPLIWLHRGLRGGDLRDFLDVPEGNYQVLVLRENIRDFSDPSADFSALPSSRDVLFQSRSPLRVNIGSGSTVIISKNGTSYSVEVVEENLANPTPEVRVYHFSDLGNARLSILRPNANPAIVWEGKAGDQSTLPLPRNPGSVNYQMEIPGSGQRMVRQVFEVSHQFSPSVSFVIFNDRYGRSTARVLANRP
jgi:hypothetical protein